MYKVAVDIGGTFTDCVVLDGEGEITISKAPTTADDPSIGVFDALTLGCNKIGLTVDEVFSSCEVFIHGCTIATNAIIERTGAKTAFVTTKGHEDMLLIGKLNQKVAGLTEMEIIHTSKLSNADPPLVPRNLVFGVSERVVWNGDILLSLNLAELDNLLKDLAVKDVESIAVCLLWSFMNPKHEQQIKKFLEDKFPNIYYSVMSPFS